MKTSIALVSLLTFAPFARANVTAANSTTAEARFSDEAVSIGYALAHVTEDALDLAIQYSRAGGIQGTVAGSELGDLINDTEVLHHSAVRLSILLDDNASDEAVRAEIAMLEIKYQAVTNGCAKIFLQLNSQGKVTEAYQLRSAYANIRGRYVYLKGQLGL